MTIEEQIANLSVRTKLLGARWKGSSVEMWSSACRQTKPTGDNERQYGQHACDDWRWALQKYERKERGD